MIRAFFIQLVITFSGYLWLSYTSTQSANAFVAGGLVIAANFLALAILWSLIFKKKLIALSASLIVFKYAILGLIIYQLITVYRIDLFWFAMGIASFILSALVYTLWLGLTRP
jgi:hypothetical protein